MGLISVAHNKPWLGVPLNRGHPLARGLVGCWLMNEGRGSLLSDSAKNNGQSEIIGTSSILWVQGKHGPCLRFSGTASTYVQGYSLSLPGDLTFAYWIAPDDPLADEYIMSFAGGANEFEHILGYQDSFYNVYGAVYPFSNDPVLSQIPVSGSGQWDFVVWTKSGTVLTGYVNGIQKTQGIITGGDFTPGANFRLGRPYSVDAALFTGLLSQLCFYNRALSASEIQKLYADPFGMFRRDPIELWGSLGVPAPLSVYVYDTE